MHDKNNNEKLFIMILNSENIKKKQKRFLLIQKLRKILIKSVFYLCIRKFIDYFNKKKNFRNEYNKLKTIFIKLFTNL